MVIGSTLMRVASVNAVPNAPIAVAKQIAPAEISAGCRPGISTSMSTRQGEAPKERAAGKAVAREEKAGDAGDDERRHRYRRRKRERRDEAAEIGRVRQHRAVGGEAVRPARADQRQAPDRQQPESGED